MRSITQFIGRSGDEVKDDGRRVRQVDVQPPDEVGYAAAAPSGEAKQLTDAEVLLLLKANNKAGYVDVLLFNDGRPKPYQARVTRDSKRVRLGSFATAEEAALCVARAPEGQAVVRRRLA